MDTVIKGARIMDGSGEPSYRGDVGVRGGRIAWVAADGAAPPGPSAAREVDAGGLALAPGFIDMHAHSDLALLADPDHSAKAAQGVTLEVVGQDGLSYAPADATTLDQVRAAVAGWNGDGAGVPGGIGWRSVGGYLDRIDQGTAVDAAYLVPQGSVRMLAMGWDDRPATAAELDRMRGLLDTGLAEGALGMSSGLTYAPGMYAGFQELAALCRVVAARGGYYCPHHRSYGAGALDAYREMVEVARAAGCALHLAHATMNFAPNAGRGQELLDLVDQARCAGADVTLDTYPYTPGSTTLAALLPGWASAGGPAAILSRLSDAPTAGRIRHAMEVDGCDGGHGVPIDWDAVEVAGVAAPELGDHVGRTVAAIARDRGEAPFDTALRLLVRDRLATAILQHVGDEDNVRTIMGHRVHTGGSDGILHGAKPHPRGHGTFPRYLGHYARDLGVFTQEECVAHLSARPAARLGLRDRGRIAPGLRADLVLFDPGRVRDRATFAEPRRLPGGIPHVWVAGTPVIRDGARTSALPGRSVRSRRR
ncbi:N-acyl-D-amino-acid deacylase family protein [Nocardiopsis coralliicola]